MAMTHEQRVEAQQIADSKNIVDVAQSLGMNLVKNGRNYTWSDHDSFVLNTKKNLFYWNSRQKGGGPIQLVKLIKECSRREAISYLSGVEISTFDNVKSSSNKPFQYYMKEHSNMKLTIDYLVKNRQLSLETVNFFIDKGLIAQSTYKDKETGKTEPVIVFKHYGFDGKIKGVALQGIWENHELHGERGRLKRTWGDGYQGLVVPIGNPPSPQTATEENPLTIIIFEAPIDLMSYYELNKDTIGDAVLLCMNGLRKETVSKYIANVLRSEVSEEEKINVLNDLQKSQLNTKAIKLVLAVDNDEAGREFAKNFGDGFGVLEEDIPPILPGKEKSDYNDVLKESKKIHVQEKGEEIPMEQTKTNETTIPIQPMDYMKDFQEALEQSITKMEVNDQPTHYITEPELASILEAQFSKIETLLSNFQASTELVATPTKEAGEQLKEGVEQTVAAVTADTKRSLSSVLAESKQVAITNMKDHANQLRLTMKNGFNQRILSMNSKIRRLVETIEKKFALEPTQKNDVPIVEKEPTPEPVQEEQTEVVTSPSPLIRDVQTLIQLKETNQQLLTNIQETIQKDPLADVHSFQLELKENQESIAAVEQKIHEQTPSVSETEEEKTSEIDQLSALVKEKADLESTREAVVRTPEFLRKEGSLDAFNQVDQQLNVVNKKIEAIEQGTFPKQEVETKETESPDLFDAVAATSVKQVVEGATKEQTPKKNEQTEKEVNKKVSSMEPYYDSTTIQTYLKSAVNFHDYSEKNQQLILEQDPQATQVANAKKWETLGYTLRDDAQSINIYQPVFVEGQKNPEYQLSPVYDVRQTTEGQLKTPLTYDLETREAFTSVYDSLKDVSKAAVVVAPLKDGTSQYQADTNTIVINEGLGRQGTMQAYLHEAVTQAQTSKQSEPLLQQFEKQAVEYMVATHIGIEPTTPDFSIINQLKDSGIPLKEFSDSVKNSTATAKSMIQKMDKHYAESLDKTATKNPFEERVVKAKVETKAVERAYQAKEQTEEKTATVRR